MSFQYITKHFVILIIMLALVTIEGFYAFLHKQVSSKYLPLMLKRPFLLIK